ncbi:histone-like nucleoid-structuring protein Lsr2 [Ornithinimicrobium pratense]|uniref:Lsr2 family protein n=1 Tax=Ornithinimicrobium pratense TaxID=2593973 RepID=A0A5J6V6M3_9MICO|nr:Lsr2 family protein [Ornithinimicrobium pratense]QFG69237.1 Lsr2 family protein [Ornithinimicrobium pratense]
MAQRVQTILVDDIEGTDITDGGQTVQFAIDGVSYEIDLSDENGAKMRETFKLYTDHARRVARRRQSAPARGTTTARTDKAQLDAIRRWARDNGHQVSDRGRIRKEIVDAFEAAH